MREQLRTWRSGLEYSRAVHGGLFIYEKQINGLWWTRCKLVREAHERGASLNASTPSDPQAQSDVDGYLPVLVGINPLGQIHPKCHQLYVCARLPYLCRIYQFLPSHPERLDVFLRVGFAETPRCM